MYASNRFPHHVYQVREAIHPLYINVAFIDCVSTGNLIFFFQEWGKLVIFLFLMLKLVKINPWWIYFSKNSSLAFAKSFADELFNSISLYNEESWFLGRVWNIIYTKVTDKIIRRDNLYTKQLLYTGKKKLNSNACMCFG